MPTDVYYSVNPFGTGDIKVACNISIAGGAGQATFSVAQTGNIGMGCHVISANIDGYIAEMTSPTSAKIVTALGAAHGNVSSEALTSISHEYASFSAAESGFTDVNHVNTTNLVTGDYLVHICCYYDQDDYTLDTGAGVTISFGTTDATRYFRWYCPAGGTESINDQFPPDGIYDTNKYVYSISSGDLEIGQEYTRMERVQLTDTTISSIMRLDADAKLGVYIDKCIFKGDGTNTPKAMRRATNPSVAGTWIIRNCIFYDFTDDAISLNWGNHDFEFYNCVVSDCTNEGFNFNNNEDVVTIKNCAVFNTADDFTGNIDTIDYCASDDGDGTNAQSLGGTPANWNNAFTDYANGDFSVKDTSSVLYDNGTTISGASPDIIGTTRPQSSAYDIGAFELIVQEENRNYPRGVTRGNVRGVA